jgi:hypothetical protein
LDKRGLKHFADTTNAKAEKLPTQEETEQIKKEQESLPPLGSLQGYDDSAMIAIRAQQQMRESMMLRAAIESQRTSDEVFLLPAIKDADKGSS